MHLLVVGRPLLALEAHILGEDMVAERPALSTDIDKFLAELGWREFCRHLLFDTPELAMRNLQPAFDAFPWRPDHKALRAWQRGQTGYPIVDAGMRELWATGWMPCWRTGATSFANVTPFWTGADCALAGPAPAAIAVTASRPRPPLHRLVIPFTITGSPLDALTARPWLHVL